MIFPRTVYAWSRFRIPTWKLFSLRIFKATFHLHLVFSVVSTKLKVILMSNHLYLNCIFFFTKRVYVFFFLLLMSFILIRLYVDVDGAHFFPFNILLKYVLLLSTFYMWRNWGTSRFSKFPKITQGVNNKID